MLTPKQQLIIASIIGGISVILGAFAAHGLKAYTSPHYMDVFEKAVRYAMYHAFAILIIATVQLHYPSTWLQWAALFFIFGILLFSGSLFLLVLLQIKWMGMITPIGGLCFIAAWALSAFGFSKLNV